MASLGRILFASLAATAVFAAFYAPIYIVKEKEWVLKEFEVVTPTTPVEILVVLGALAAVGTFLRLVSGRDLVWHYVGRYLMTIAWPLYAYFYVQTPGEPFGTMLMELRQGPSVAVTIRVDLAPILLIIFALAALTFIHITLQMVHQARSRSLEGY